MPGTFQFPPLLVLELCLLGRWPWQLSPVCSQSGFPEAQTDHLPCWLEGFLVSPLTRDKP